MYGWLIGPFCRLTHRGYGLRPDTPCWFVDLHERSPLIPVPAPFRCHGTPSWGMVSFDLHMIDSSDEGHRHAPNPTIRQKTGQSYQASSPQRHIEALHQALLDLGMSDDLVAEIEGRLRSQKQLMGKIFALMFPTLFGSRSAHELTRVRGWDKHWPSRILGALPKRSWLK